MLRIFKALIAQSVLLVLLVHSVISTMMTVLASTVVHMENVWMELIHLNAVAIRDILATHVMKVQMLKIQASTQGKM